MKKNLIYIRSSFIAFVLLFASQIYGQFDFILTVNYPESVQGEYEMALGSFGPSFCEIDEFIGQLAFVEDSTGGTLACDTVMNDLSGLIAVIDRGDCDFSSKIYRAQLQGAIAAIVCNHTDEPNFAMGLGESGDSVTIPSFMLGLNDCTAIRAEIGDSVSISIQRNFPVDENSDDLVVWQEDFDGGLNNWANNSIQCGGVSDPANASWTWAAGGDIGKGSFAPEGAIIFSNSPCNGAIIFDSDFLDSEGDGLDPDTGGAIEENLGDGPCVSPQEAEIISPVIDISSADPSSVIGIKFIQSVRDFDAQFFIGWSADGGANWSETEINTELEVNDGKEEITRLALGGVSSGDQLMIKFRFLGDYYYWAIDDVRIIEFTGTNAELSDVFYTPFSFSFPQSQADADTFFFSTTVTNKGGTVLDQVRLDVDVVNFATSDVVFETSGTVNNVGINADSTLVADDVFVPVNLDTALYQMIYTITVPDDVETDLNDNEDTRFFRVTENWFAKEPGPTTAFAFGVPWKVGNLYVMSPNKSAFVMDSVAFSVASNAASFRDNFVDIFVLKLNPGIFEGGFADFDINDIDLNGHPSFEIVGQVTHVFTDEQNFDLITIPLSSGGGGIPVEAGAAYLIMLVFDDSQAGQATVPNYDIFLAFNDVDLEYTFISTVITLDQPVGSNMPQWFLGGTGPEDAAVIRLSVSLSSGVDDVPLPDGVFNLYPNPSGDYTIVDLNFDEPSDVDIIAATLEGKVLQMKTLKKVSNYQERIELNGLPSGIYLIRVSTKDGTKTHKLIVQH